MSLEEIVDSVMAMEDPAELTLSELARLSGLSREALRALVECGLIEPRSNARGGRRFSVRSVRVARRARRLRADFDLNASGLVLALTLLQRIETLEARLREVECQLLR